MDTAPPRKKRFSRTDWTDLGLDQLKDHGPDAMIIEQLCETAGKTRGSFYFHFETIDDFLTALAHEWQYRFTDDIIQRKTAVTRLDCLNLLAARLDLDLERGIRELSLRNPQVAEIVRQTDTARIAWLSALYQQTNRYDGEESENLARIEYAAFIGFKLVNATLTPGEARGLYDAFLRFTGRS